MDKNQQFQKQAQKIYRLFVLLFALFGLTVLGVLYLLSDPGLSAFKSTEPIEVITDVPIEDDFDKIENGIHVRTGLLEADGLMTVVNNCTNCHSAQLVTQNRMNRERWIATIRWMQETQNLWDLGGNEEIIVNYLVSNYPPKNKGRREGLGTIHWYELQN
jgi:hypothetical protein